LNHKNPILQKGRAFRLGLFAKMLNYPRATSREFKRVLSFLERSGIVAIQQGGFLGDNMHHPKLVVIRKPLEIEHFRRVVLLQRNYRLGDFSVHVTGKDRECAKCHKKIRRGERYGVRVQLRRRRWARKVLVYAQEILCFPCLIEKINFEDLENLITRGTSADFSEETKGWGN
jgi:hypothetical protein